MCAHVHRVSNAHAPMTRKIGPFTLKHQAQFGLNPALVTSGLQCDHNENEWYLATMANSKQLTDTFRARSSVSGVTVTLVTTGSVYTG